MKSPTRISERLNRLREIWPPLRRPAGLEGCAIILHGVSCSGKSTLLKQLRRQYRGATFFEMDDLRYWVDDADEELLADLSSYLRGRGVDQRLSERLIELIRSARRHGGRNRYKSMSQLARLSLTETALVVTCGNLPPPGARFEFYQAVADLSGKRLVNVLVAPSSAELAERIRRRNKDETLEALLESNEKRRLNSRFYDIVLEGGEQLEDVLARFKSAGVRTG